MIPEFAEAMKRCSTFSCIMTHSIASKGKATFMLKGSSKKKRSRVEMEEVKHEEDELNEDKYEFLKQYKKFNTTIAT